MKHITTTLLISLLSATLTTLLANDQVSIDQQIAAMQKASPQERVKLMNQFKQQLASMNAEERAKSIGHLRQKMQGEHSGKHADTEMHNEAQRNQMQQSEHLQRMEQMQQRHGGDQHMYEKENWDMGSKDSWTPKQH
jgi:hypothetical protein